MTACYAKVFEHNGESRRLLERLGFEDMEIRARPPDEAEKFYQLDSSDARATGGGELRKLMSRVSPSTHLEPQGCAIFEEHHHVK